MNPQKMKEAYQRLEMLDERLTYKIRSGTRTMVQPTPDQINAKVKDLAEYTMELKDILRDFMLSFANPPRNESPPGIASPPTPPQGQPPS